MSLTNNDLLKIQQIIRIETSPRFEALEQKVEAMSEKQNIMQDVLLELYKLVKTEFPIIYHRLDEHTKDIKMIKNFLKLK